MSIIGEVLNTAEHNHAVSLMIAMRSGESSDWERANAYANEVEGLRKAKAELDAETEAK